MTESIFRCHSKNNADKLLAVKPNLNISNEQFLEIFTYCAAFDTGMEKTGVTLLHALVKKSRI